MTAGADKPNLSWPVYKNLEKEVLELTDEIHFCDEQLNVYSVKIAELVFRISAEIESLLRHFYRIEEEKDSNETGLIMKYLTKRWKLDKKIVMISAPNMYFRHEENLSFSPFGYVKEDKNDYYSAYNAVKHDRVKNISKANVRILIRALAALYLLNIYYKDDEFTPSTFDPRLGSSIFSIRAASTGLDLENGTVSDADECCAYVHKYSDPDYIKYFKNSCEVMDKQKEEYLASEHYRKYIEAGNEVPSSNRLYLNRDKVREWNIMNEMNSISDFEEKKKYLLGSPSYKRFIEMGHRCDKAITTENIEDYMRMVILSITPIAYSMRSGSCFASDARHETVLNKQQKIYPN